MIALISLTSLATVVLLILGIAMKSERVLVRERVERMSRSAPNELDSVRAELDMSFRERVAVPFLRRLAGLASRSTPTGAIQALEIKLESAGRPWRLGGLEFIGLKVLIAVVFFALGFVVVRVTHATPFYALVFMVLFLLIGIVLPDAYLNNTITVRRVRLRRALADTLDLLSVSVEAGLGLEGAMQKVVEKQTGPLADEMGRALQEMQFGKTRAEALRDMAQRSNVQELGAFVASIIQAEQLGVSITKVLRIQGETMRARRSQLARELAAKLPVKLLFPLVFCIFPALYVVVVTPGAIQIGRALGIIK